MVEAGEGDLIVRSPDYPGVFGRGGDHTVRRLHDCFDLHRTRVRELALQVSSPPSEAKRSSEALLGSLTRFW